MNRKTKKLMTTLAIGVASYVIYDKFFASPASSTAGLGLRNWRQGQGYGAWGGEGVDNTQPDTFSNNPYGSGGRHRYSNYPNSYFNNYDPRVTEQSGGLSYQSALLDAMESGN